MERWYIKKVRRIGHLERSEVTFEMAAEIINEGAITGSLLSQGKFVS